MKVRVDRDLCIGVGNCVAIAPMVFKLDAVNKAVVLDISSVDDDTLLEAAESCPSKLSLLRMMKDINYIPELTPFTQ